MLPHPFHPKQSKRMRKWGLQSVHNTSSLPYLLPHIFPMLWCWIPHRGYNSILLLVWACHRLKFPSGHFHLLWCVVLHRLQCGHLLTCSSMFFWGATMAFSMSFRGCLEHLLALLHLPWCLQGRFTFLAPLPSLPFLNYCPKYIKKIKWILRCVITVLPYLWLVVQLCPVLVNLFWKELAGTDPVEHQGIP